MRRPPAVARVLERVTATVRRHELFVPGTSVLVAVSGGPDSVCLLESLVRLRRLFRISVSVAHVDHGLRSGSARDAAYVRRLAARHGLDVQVLTTLDAPPPGASVEAWARDGRRTGLAQVARTIGAERIALGHTLDDQAETVLLNLLTGSGLQGLAGIAPLAGPWINPLLDVTRAEVEASCRSLGLRPRRDVTNEDPRYLRNALRLEGIPALERITGRALVEPLARTADALRPDAHELARQAAAAAEGVVDETPQGADILADALLGLPRALANRIATGAVYACGAVCTQADLEAVFDLASGRPGRRRDLSAGVKARRGRTHVHIERR
jgi:tRNA(Ile)-lysidine synthase